MQREMCMHTVLCVCMGRHLRVHVHGLVSICADNQCFLLVILLNSVDKSRTRKTKLLHACVCVCVCVCGWVWVCVCVCGWVGVQCLLLYI